MRIQRLSPQQIKTSSPLYRVFIEDFWIQNVNQKSKLAILPEVIVHQQAQGYRLLFGFGLFEKVGTDKIPALIFPQQTAPLNWLTELARFVRQHRELYPIEVARLSRLMNHLKIPQADADNLIHAMTGIKSLSGLVPQLRKLINVVPSIQAFLIAKKAPFALWNQVSELTPGQQETFINFVGALRPSLSVFSELLVNITEAGLREGLDFATILRRIEKEFRRTCPGPFEVHALTHLRRMVFRRRFPHLSRRIARMEKRLAQIDLPATTRIDWDPTFERGTLHLSVEIGTVEDLVSLRNFLSSTGLQKLSPLLDELKSESPG